ncbi:MAG: 50S ribosomal protein L21 [Solirubrobacterales bacterium]
MAYAIIEISGKQYRVEKGDSVVVDRLDAKQGAKVTPRALLYADGGKSMIGEAEAGKVEVEAKVAEHMKGDKVRVFKYRAKKRYRVTQGYRSALTRLEITDIKAGAGAAATEAKPKPKAEPKAAPKPARAQPARKKAAAKPAAKKPATRKSAAKKPTAKKPTTRKPATKKKDGQ